MNLKKFLHDHIPFLPHGSWKKAAESINRKPQNFNEKSGWPHMVAKLEEAEKVFGAWGYRISIFKEGGISFGSGMSEETPEMQKQSKEDFNNPDNYYHSP